MLRVPPAADPEEDRRLLRATGRDTVNFSMTTDAAEQDPGALIEAYYEQGWTDGLPVVPPSDASIEAMLAAGGFRGDEVIGEIAGRNTEVVADKVAINAVMAGCRPEYLPVVVAALRGLCHPDFAYHGPASSTGGSAMVLIVNGPIVRRSWRSTTATTPSARATVPTPRSGAPCG